MAEKDVYRTYQWTKGKREDPIIKCNARHHIAPEEVREKSIY